MAFDKHNQHKIMINTYNDQLKIRSMQKKDNKRQHKIRDQCYC